MFQESCGTTRTSSSRIWSRSPISTIRTYARWNGFREEEKFTATHFREILYARRKENPTRKYYFFTYKNKFSILDYKSTSYFNPQINVLCFIIVVVHSEKENRNKMFFVRIEMRKRKKKEKKVHKRARAHTHKHTRDTPLNTTSNTLFSLQRNDDVWATVSPITRRTLCDRVFRV